MKANSADDQKWTAIFRHWLMEEAKGDPAHDRQHIERVVITARELAGQEQLSLEIVLPAAWLHDCVHVEKSSPQRSQASLMAADHAVTLLREWAYPEEYLDAIHHSIHAHSFSADIETKTLEAKVLQDADRLDAIGAVGLSRCLMLGGYMGSQLYSLDDPFCDSREPDDGAYCIDHFYKKLLTLEGTMKTDSGKNLAAERTEFLKCFLSQLGKEIGGNGE